VFVGIGPADAVEGHPAGVQRDRVVTLEAGRDTVAERLRGPRYPGRRAPRPGS